MKPQIMPGAEPFYYPGDETGCLLIHGFTGTPWEMKPLGQYLSRQGYSVLGLRLQGHGTHWQDMARANWEDWAASVEDGYHLLRKSCKRILLMGLSMGGALTLYTGSYLNVDGLVAMAAPYEMQLPGAQKFIVKHADLFSKIVPMLKKDFKEDRSDWYKPEYGQGSICYLEDPVRSAGQLRKLLENARECYSDISVPTQLIYSKGDQTVSAAQGEVIYDLLRCDKELHILENSSHMIPTDGERGTTFEIIQTFIQKYIEK